ncbi:MAG: hypothetical protein FWE80_07835, partial [Oscillospiraceae bacterium]|nr:hypothetical protein [Oscillospiraceae bacterium]
DVDGDFYLFCVFVKNGQTLYLGCRIVGGDWRAAYEVPGEKVVHPERESITEWFDRQLASS